MAINPNEIFRMDGEEFLPPDSTPNESLDNLTQLPDLEDGSAVFEFGDGQPEDMGQEAGEIEDFYANIVDEVDEGECNRTVNEILEGIDNDISSRSEWENSFNKGLKYLGFKVEEFRDYPFMRSCSAYDSTLSTALLRFWSTARAELFPATGPARFQIVGEATDELEAQGERVKGWFNHYLTHVDKEYYPDSERMLMYLGMVGCAFRKVYQHPITNRPVARFIDPQDFIVDNKATSILSSTRLSQRMYLNRREIMLRQMSGLYSDDVEIPDSDDDNADDLVTTKNVRSIEGIQSDNTENKTLFKVYECHVDLDLEGFEHVGEDGQPSGMPLPYIVTICEASREIFAIRRNWVEDDPTYQRIECFTQYNYLPGFGIYGIGLAQLLGSNAIALTSIQRQLIDAGTLKNFPGGLKTKGLRMENNDKAIGPSEFWEIETGGMPIQDCVMLMPYNEPSVVLKELRAELIQQTQQLASTAETQVSDAKAEAPVGTTLALLEVQNKVQSSVLRSLHMSLSNELELLYRLFGEGMEENPYDFKTIGMSSTIQKKDFNENIRIIPVSDPNLTTSTQRIIRAESILRLAQSAPELHDLRDAYHRMYTAMGIENLDKLLPPEEDVLPFDPITENMNLMEGKPVKAALWQDHKSHIEVHSVFAQQNPDIQALPAHIQEHRAYDYYIQMQTQMGMELPPLEELEDPQIQNSIALKAAEVAMQQRAATEQQNPPPIDPNTVMLMDIEARKEIAALKLEEAELRAQVESYKATLHAESEKAKMESQERIADEKNETDLIIADVKEAAATNRAHATVAAKVHDTTVKAHTSANKEKEPKNERD